MLAVPKVLSTARGLRTRIERKDVEGILPVDSSVWGRKTWGYYTTRQVGV